MKLRYHSSCSTISIYSFDKIVSTDDYRYMVVGWDEIEEIKIKEDEVRDLWFKIYNEYVELSNDNKISLYYQTLNELSNLKMRKYVVETILERILTLYDKEFEYKYIKILRGLRFYIDKSKPLSDEVKKMEAQLRGANNKIAKKESELKDLKSDEKPTPLMKQVVQLEQATGRNEIDPRKTTVEKWLFIIEVASKKNKAA